MSTVEYTPEGAVVISYNALVSSPDSLGPAIGEAKLSRHRQPIAVVAFGSHPSSLGIIVVRDVPEEFKEYRSKLLKLAYHFGNLDEAARESYSDPSTKYSFGWSHGKEIMNGKPDTLKGSYYANPIEVTADVSEAEKAEFPEYYGTNIWPKKDATGLQDFEEAFKNLSRLIFDVGCKLAIACQPFAAQHLNNSMLSLADSIRTSYTTKARLLHYFPPSPDAPAPSDDDPVDSWCGFHLDHSLLTGLCPAMFLRRTDAGPEIIPSPSPTSGLYIRTRGGDLTKVAIPQDCIAFQTGEALEIATNGRLLATPHCVRVGSFSTKDEISRESFALFMQPNTNQHLSDDTTFGQFSKRIFSEHYDEIAA